MSASSRDPRTSFNSAADVYHEIRPGYPRAMFDDLFRLLPTRPSILEVGPGTGQATRDLIDRRATVEAIEIGPATADKLRSVTPSNRLRVTVDDFETVDLDGRRFDAVFSATAYHWISPKAQLDRPATILTPGRIIAT